MRKIASSLICLCLSAPTFGQDATVTEANLNYADRVIASDQLQVLEDEFGESETYDDSGLPRAWRMELAAGVTSNNESTQHEAGVLISGYLETVDYGAWSFDVDANRNNAGDTTIGRMTIYQRDMALNHGWRIDNSFGTLGAPMPSMLRQQYRFILPTPAFLGISSEVRNSDGRIINAAIGRAGSRSAGRFSNFDTSGGSLFEIGGQTRNGPLQAAATIVSSQNDDGSAQVSALTALAWSQGSSSVQANVLNDDNDGIGVWIDGISKPDHIEHRYGIFRFDPMLEWAGQSIQSDLQGIYYRAASRQARWIWSGGLDHVESVSGDTASINYFTAQGRYQVSSRWGFGGASSARITSGGGSSSLQAFMDKKTKTGTARMQIEQARSKELRSEQISWDQSFANIDSFQWSAKLGFMQQHDHFERSGQEWSAAIYGSRDFGSQFRWDSMLRYTDGTGPLAQSGVEANVSLNWIITPSWSLAATYFQNQGRRPSPFNLDPLQVPTTDLDENDRSFFLTLRYEHRAGRAVGVIGGAVGSGAGNIVGDIYLDANADGRRNADELPVADILVLLDGRYQTRTDTNGRFSFDRVAAGSHTLLTVSDNLPLPWQLPSDEKTIEVKVRDTARWSVGALQPTK